MSTAGLISRQGRFDSGPAYPTGAICRWPRRVWLVYAAEHYEPRLRHDACVAIALTREGANEAIRVRRQQATTLDERLLFYDVVTIDLPSEAVRLAATRASQTGA